ncbi:hypothetical protein KEJ34_02070 [Candidatus Bathyarchaeota archaeon]|nr:hypothetical protein [Candidatus Bathyarchaeota archaeon]
MNRKFKMYGAFVLLGIIVPIVLSVALSSKPVSEISFRIGNRYYYEFKYSGNAEGEIIEARVKTPPGYFGSVPPLPPFKRYSLVTGIDLIVKQWKMSLLLPTWLPEGMKYADVYIGPVIIITFSYEKTEDFMGGEFGIQIKMGNPPGTLDELNKTVEPSKREGDKYIELMKMGDIWAVVAKKRPNTSFIMAWFFYKGEYYYIVDVKSPPLTLQDLVKIIESMKPVAE